MEVVLMAWLKKDFVISEIVGLCIYLTYLLVTPLREELVLI